MLKYLSLIIFLVLFFINCGEPPKRPSGTVSESLEVLKIDRKIKDVGTDIYEMDLFYKFDKYLLSFFATRPVYCF